MSANGRSQSAHRSITRTWNGEPICVFLESEPASYLFRPSCQFWVPMFEPLLMVVLVPSPRFSNPISKHEKRRRACRTDNRATEVRRRIPTLGEGVIWGIECSSDAAAFTRVCNHGLCLSLEV